MQYVDSLTTINHQCENLRLKIRFEGFIFETGNRIIFPWGPIEHEVLCLLSTRSKAAVKSIQSTDAIFVGKKLSFNTDLSFPNNKNQQHNNSPTIYSMQCMSFSHNQNSLQYHEQGKKGMVMANLLSRSIQTPSEQVNSDELHELSDRSSIWS